MLAIDDLVLPANAAKDRMRDLLKPKPCPNCDEPNKPESKFCAKCKFVLTFDAFNEAMEEREKAAREAEEQRKALSEGKKDTEELKNQMQMLREEMRQISERFVSLATKGE